MRVVGQTCRFAFPACPTCGLFFRSAEHRSAGRKSCGQGQAAAALAPVAPSRNDCTRALGRAPTIGYTAVAVKYQNEMPQYHETITGPLSAAQIIGCTFGGRRSGEGDNIPLSRTLSFFQGPVMKYFERLLRIIVCLSFLLIIAAIGCKKAATPVPNVARGMEIMSSSWGGHIPLQSMVSQ